MPGWEDSWTKIHTMSLCKLREFYRLDGLKTYFAAKIYVYTCSKLKSDEKSAHFRESMNSAPVK